MPEDNTTVPKTISFHVTNLTAEDARFLSAVIGMFTDPAKKPLSDMLRRPDCNLRYGHHGYARLCSDFIGQ